MERVQRVKTVNNTQFKAVMLPLGEHAIIPADLDVLIPKAPRIAPEDRHFLAYLPWEAKYLRHIPAEHQAFFKFVLPFLHARTTNVHTALSVSQLSVLLKEVDRPVNERLLYLALILHDAGWSQVSLQDILYSLNYTSVTPSSNSMRSKQQHLVYGEALGYQLLDTFDFGDNPLSSDDIYTIAEMIRRHDHDAVWEKGKYSAIAFDIKLLCDSDRLWSYTYENFWLDTIRKGVAPDVYLETITREISSYFMTKYGKAQARRLIQGRKAEVAAYLAIAQNPAKVHNLIQTARHPSKRLLYRTQQLLLSARSRRLQRSMIRQNAY